MTSRTHLSPSLEQLRNHFSKDLEQVIQRMIRLSYGGDMQAAKVLFEMMSGKYDDSTTENISSLTLTDEQALQITQLAQSND